VAFPPDGARVLSRSMDATIKLWNVASGALIRTFEGHSDWVIAVGVESTGNVKNSTFNGRRQPSGGGTSRVMREYQVRNLWARGEIPRAYSAH
jgi:WD40 repeat protein